MSASSPVGRNRYTSQRKNRSAGLSIPAARPSGILESLQATGELEHLTREILNVDEAESADSDTDSL